MKKWKLYEEADIILRKLCLPCLTKFVNLILGRNDTKSSRKKEKANVMFSEVARIGNLTKQPKLCASCLQWLHGRIQPGNGTEPSSHQYLMFFFLHITKLSGMDTFSSISFHVDYISPFDNLLNLIFSMCL